MSGARRLGGREPAAAIRTRTAGVAAALAAAGRTPRLAVVLATRDESAVIDPTKDVDGANPESLGRLATGLPAFAPATAAAVLALLEHHVVTLAGRHAVDRHRRRHESHRRRWAHGRRRGRGRGSRQCSDAGARRRRARDHRTPARAHGPRGRGGHRR